MQFLTTDGRVSEGVPLTDHQVALRPEIEDVIHATVCGGAEHEEDYPACLRAADKLIMRYAMVAIESEERPSQPKPSMSKPPAWLHEPLKAKREF